MVERPHRVLLVREWDEQMSGSGCCGRLGSDVVQHIDEGVADPYHHTRVDMERVAAVYLALRDRYTDEELELTVVDPRNTVWLLPTVLRDARRRGLSFGATLRQLNAATAACAVVCDGKVLTTSTDPQQVLDLVAADLAARTA